MLITSLNKFKNLIFVLLIFSLTACSTLNETKSSYKINVNVPKKFKVLRVDQSGTEVSDRVILEALQRNISKLSYYPDFYSKTRTTSKNISGFDVVIGNKNNIKIQYFNGKTSSIGKPKLTSAIATLKIDIRKTKNGLYKTIVVHPPGILAISRAKTKISSITTLDRPTRLYQMSSIKTLDTPIKLTQDVEQIFQNIKLSVSKFKLISGEIIVKNNKFEVLRNFKHKLVFKGKSSIQRKNKLVGLFNLKSPLQKNSVPLRIKIIPDAKGSRVEYEFDVNYIIYSNGTTSYSKKAVNSLVTMIKNISTTKDLNASISHLKVNTKNLIAIVDDPFSISTDQQKSATYTPRVKATTKVQKTKPKNSPKLTKKSKNKSNKKLAKIKGKKLSAKLKTQTDTVKSKKTFKTPKTTSLGKDQKVERVVSFEKKSNNLKNIEYIEKMLSSLKDLRASE